MLQAPTGLNVGTSVRVRTRLGPFWTTIEALHVDGEPGRSFNDVMVAGPFARWQHRHRSMPQADGCRLRDEVDCALPFGWLGRLVEPIAVCPRLRRLFAYRHGVTRSAVLGVSCR